MNTKSLLAGLALATLATTPVLADEPVTTRTEVQKACKVVMVSSDDAQAAAGAPHTVMVTARSIDGADATMKVNVLGIDGQPGDSFDVQGLEVGETKSFTTADGREIEMTRTADAVTLTVDGKEITLPSLANVAMIPGGTMGGQMHAFIANADSTTGEGAGEHEVMVFQGGPHAMMAPALPMAFAGRLDGLKALEGADPAVREKVLEALHEIFSQPMGADFEWTEAISGAEGEATGASAGQPGAPHVIIRRVGVAPPAEGGSQVE